MSLMYMWDLPYQHKGLTILGGELREFKSSRREARVLLPFSYDGTCDHIEKVLNFIKNFDANFRGKCLTKQSKQCMPPFICKSLVASPMVGKYAISKDRAKDIVSFLNTL